MKRLNFQWRKNKAQYQTGETLYINGIRVASYGWNSTGSRDNPNRTNWFGRIELPSLKEATASIYDNDEDKIKKRIEEIVTRWVNRLLAPPLK